MTLTEKILCFIGENIAVITASIASILSFVIAIVTITSTTKREARSQQYGFRKEFYIKHYDSMLELLAEYEDAFYYLDHLLNISSALEKINEEKEIEIMAKQMKDDMRNIDALCTKIELRINQDNPHAEQLSEALSNASDDTNWLLLFGTAIKMVVTNKNTDGNSDNADKTPSEECSENDSKTMKYEDLVDIVRGKRKRVQVVAKNYLTAERKALLKKRGI